MNRPVAEAGVVVARCPAEVFSKISKILELIKNALSKFGLGAHGPEGPNMGVDRSSALSLLRITCPQVKLLPIHPPCFFQARCMDSGQ